MKKCAYCNGTGRMTKEGEKKYWGLVQEETEKAAKAYVKKHGSLRGACHSIWGPMSVSRIEKGKVTSFRVCPMCENPLRTPIQKAPPGA